jgi:hypothetical protein
MNSKKDALKFYEIGCRAKNLFLYDVAIKYLEQAVSLGNVESMIELGDIFHSAGNSDDLHKPKEIMQSDKSKALKFYSQAAEKNYPLAFNRLALIHLNECNVEETYKFFQLAVETYEKKLDSSFDAFTIKALAKAYEDLYFVEPDKRKSKKLLQKFLEYYRLAFEMLKILADEGNIEAFFELGEMYRVGNGTDKSYSNAIKMFKNAAKRGSTGDKIRAYINIAFICKSEENYNQFIDYIKKAAELGDFWAMRQLWKYYLTGENLTAAEHWLKKSEEIQTEFLTVLKREEN